jgi:hypothetical protein
LAEVRAFYREHVAEIPPLIESSETIPPVVDEEKGVFIPESPVLCFADVGPQEMGHVLYRIPCTDTFLPGEDEGD